MEENVRVFFRVSESELEAERKEKKGGGGEEEGNQKEEIEKKKNPKTSKRKT